MKDIPIAAAKAIADKYEYDQIVIIGREVGVGEHVTTFGKDPENCNAAGMVGDFLRFKVMAWAKDGGNNPTPETGWVIEREGSPTSKPDYWTGSVNPLSWSEDHLEAVRFARQADAARFMHNCFDAANMSHRVAEHMWNPS